MSASAITYCNDEQPDMEPIAYSNARLRFLKHLEECQDKRSRERITKNQNLDMIWHQIRQNLLNCCYFERILNSENRESYKALLDEMMYTCNQFGNSAQNRHAMVQQKEALNIFKKYYKDLPLKESGLFIDADLPYLGATPFMLYGEEHILNIKCPLKVFKQDIDKAIRNKKIPFWQIMSGEITINKKSSWFIEIQGQLHVTQRQYAFIMIWLCDSESQHRVVEISKDDKFFEEEMKPKLTYFYNEVMLKELVDSRKARNMVLREYNVDTQSFK